MRVADFEPEVLVLLQSCTGLAVVTLLQEVDQSLRRVRGGTLEREQEVAPGTVRQLRTRLEAVPAKG